jgi:hypothetical protein
VNSVGVLGWPTSRIKEPELSISSGCESKSRVEGTMSSCVGRSTGRGAGGFVMEITGTDDFCDISGGLTGPCPLRWEGAVLLTSIRTGIGTSAPELAVVLARSKTPRPTFSGACKQE